MTTDVPDWRITDTFRRLRASVVAAATAAHASSILITSIDSGDGGNAVVTKLAGALAAAGNLVVVVLARQDPDLESRLEVDGRPGFIDALAGRARIHDTLRPTQFDNLMVCGRGTEVPSAGATSIDTDELPGTMGPVTTYYSDLLGSERPKEVIAELTSAADYVLVDAPPVQIDADAYLLAGACDGVLAVATLATATRRDLEGASEELVRVGARLLGSVLIDPEQQEESGDRSMEGARRADANSSGKARVQPASNGALTEALEA